MTWIARSAWRLGSRPRPAAAVLVMAAVLGAAPFARSSDEGRVTCQVPGEGGRREFRLAREGGTWVLGFRSRETREQWITLALPRAEPVITSEAATLSYRNANGGRQVQLEVRPGGSVLDVWVDHGLEVNIDPDLDPRVDLMNTDGRITTARCTIER